MEGNVPFKFIITHTGEKVKKKKKEQILRSALFSGAGNQSRTDDLVITNDVLYQLSHASVACDFDIIPNEFAFVNRFLKIFFDFSVFLQKRIKSTKKQILKEKL